MKQCYREGVAVVTKRESVVPGVIREDVTYFSNCKRLRSDGLKLQTLNDFGQVNYSRPMSEVREIRFHEIAYP